MCLNIGAVRKGTVKRDFMKARSRESRRFLALLCVRRWSLLGSVCMCVNQSGVTGAWFCNICTTFESTTVVNIWSHAHMSKTVASLCTTDGSIKSKLPSPSKLAI